jgi:hypothetical protein
LNDYLNADYLNGVVREENSECRLGWLQWNARKGATAKCKKQASGKLAMAVRKEKCIGKKEERRYDRAARQRHNKLYDEYLTNQKKVNQSKKPSEEEHTHTL